MESLVSWFSKKAWGENAYKRQESRSSLPVPSRDNIITSVEETEAPQLTDVAAEEYTTPQKYIDGAPIPKWYQFQSNMIGEEDLQYGMRRTLEVDRRLTLPTRTHIRLLLTASDVVHSWWVPSLGIKQDCVPGRLARINTFIQREGVFYGNCAEFCGDLHGYMPIVVEAVSPETYAAHARKWYVEED
eukprot:Selendium_serpulae@DN4260_c0_g2_i2.p1